MWDAAFSRKRRTGEQILEPLDAFQVEVIGRLVEQQKVGLTQQGFGDGQTLLPPSRQTVNIL